MRATRSSWFAIVALAVFLPAPVFAEPPACDASADRAEVPEWAARLVPEPGSPAAKAYASARKKQLQVERELKQIRFKHFMTRHAETRQVGISKLAAYTDPVSFPALLSVFEHDEADVRAAVLDHLAEQRTDEADATLAWAAVFGDEWSRQHAGERLRSRVRQAGGLSDRVRAVMLAGLRDSADEPPTAVAKLASDMAVYDLIPAIINAQTGPPPGGGGGGGGGSAGSGGALAIILIATQQAFVSDLQPVVGDSAVAFDPTLSVITEGTYIAVGDAVVVTYRTVLHDTLVSMADAAWDGRSTAGLGYNLKAWNDWYTNQFLPFRAAQAAQANNKPAP